MDLRPYLNKFLYNLSITDVNYRILEHLIGIVCILLDTLKAENKLHIDSLLLKIALFCLLFQKGWEAICRKKYWPGFTLSDHWYCVR